MIKLVGGGILLWLGIASFSDPTAPVFLIGFAIVGPILIVRGIKDIARGKKESAITSTMAGHADELNARLEQLQPIDRIAADFSVQYGIPPTRTILVSSHTIRDLARANDPVSRSKGVRLLALQQVDSTVGPLDYLERLAFDRTVFFVDEAVKAHRAHPQEKQAVEGSLILSSAYLYFFPQEKEGLARKTGGRLLDRAGEHLFPLGIVMGGYHLVKGISSELKDHFSVARRKELRQRFLLPGSFALPIARVARVTPYTHKWSLLATEFLQVNLDPGTAGDKVPGTVWLETTSANEAKWVREWMERIELACIPEGRMLEVSDVLSPAQTGSLGTAVGPAS